MLKLNDNSFSRPWAGKREKRNPTPVQAKKEEEKDPMAIHILVYKDGSDRIWADCPSITQACKVTGVSYTTIKKQLNGKETPKCRYKFVQGE